MITDHLFTVQLRKAASDTEMDDLAETCSDALFTRHADGTGEAEFARAAKSLVNAITWAVADLAAAGLEISGVGPVDLIEDPDIAARADVDMTTLVGLVDRSTVAHSKPVARPAVAGATAFYHWGEVKAWFDAHGVPYTYDRVLAATNAVLTKTEDRSKDLLRRRVERELLWMDRWRMPDWMEPYRSLIGNTGGNDIEDLVFRMQHEPDLALTNMPVCMLGQLVWEQVCLLGRLHERNCLLPPIAGAPDAV